MKGKRAFELSATFLVMLILTIVIFVGSIYFTKKFFTTAEQMKGTIDQQTEAEIERLLYSDNSIVAIPMFKKTIQRGKQDTFGLGIRNILERTENFYVMISFSKGFDSNEDVIPGTDIEHMNSKWLLYNPGPYSIQHNKMEMIPILVNAGLTTAAATNTAKGTYSFNVCVFAGVIPSGFDCSNPPRSLPDNVYSGKIYKIYAEVI